MNVGFNLTQKNDHNQTLNNNQEATTNRDTTRAMKSELPFKVGKVAARKPEVFSESMNIDEWIESLKAYLAGTNPNAATDQVLILQVKSFLSATARKELSIFLYVKPVIGCN